MAKAAFRIEASGLNQLRRDLGKIDKSIQKELISEMREIARERAEDAQKEARAQGLEMSGALIGKIKPANKGTTALIRSTVKRAGFPYGGVYEFGGSKRPFLLPAVTKNQSKTRESLVDMLDDLFKKHDL